MIIVIPSTGLVSGFEYSERERDNMASPPYPLFTLFTGLPIQSAVNPYSFDSGSARSLKEIGIYLAMRIIETRYILKAMFKMKT